VGFKLAELLNAMLRRDSLFVGDATSERHDIDAKNAAKL
jgi:hypothetical protein